MAKIPYTQDIRVIPDREVAFQLIEQGRLDDYMKSREDPEAFQRLMNFMTPRYIMKRDESTGEIRAYDKGSEAVKLSRSVSIPLEQAERLLLTIPPRELEVITLLTMANNTSYNCAANAFRLAEGDYEAATKFLEERKGLPAESPFEYSDTYADREERRNELVPIEEWVDPDIAASNVFQSCDPKELAVEGTIEDIEARPSDEEEEED